MGSCVTCSMWMAHVVYGMHGGVSELGLLFGPHEVIDSTTSMSGISDQ